MFTAMQVTIVNAARDTVDLFAGLFKQRSFYRLLAFLGLIACLKLILMVMYYVFPTFGIRELGGRTSLLDPVWYGGSFAIGVIAASLGDATSFGFVAETEKQVGDHLESHLQQLPEGDERTRAILSQMRIDEAHHGGAAVTAGGTPLPLPVRAAMQFTGKIMTTAARWV